ncbi:alpha-L-rhamnosidase-related protein [Weissella soli]|uniref:alpha-L-rhamnosidase-related protein n=1 Tax=Weissella soli TaxID=155866 RepID=UPI001F417F7D|nr:alpha-rhamnosidase [Weissella soli]GJM47977.1 alpha-L-rhamnosidase [Weissella soli]
MAFTFQINKDVVWNHDKGLLQKAEENKPALNKKKVVPKQIVELINDPSKLGDVGIIPKTTDLSELDTTQFKRDESVILDFGNHFVGHFNIDIDSVGSPMDAPLTLKVKFAEMASELSSSSEDYNGWLSRSWIQEELLHIDELPVRLEFPRRYAARFVELTVVDTSPKWSVVFSNPVVIAESAVDFDSVILRDTGDKMLNRINSVATKTLMDCMQDVFEDGPKRDRRLWLGDLRLQALANYATFDNTQLVKRGLYLFGGMTAKDGRIPANVFVKPNIVPDDTFLFDYSVFFAATLADYVEHTDDLETLKNLYDVAKKQIDFTFQYVDEDGRLTLPEDYPAFIDWSNDFDKATAAQATLIFGLKKFIILTKLMDDNNSELYVAELDKLINFTKEVLFDRENNQFIVERTGEVNIASQVWMVLAGVMDSSTNQLIMEQMIHTQFPVTGIATPYMYHHIAEALFVADMADEAKKLIKQYWGTMIELGADTFWEAFEPENPNYSPYGSPIVSSYCHAWSCTPVYLTKKYL